LAGVVFVDVLEEIPLNIAVVLKTYENGSVFRDTLDSVLHHWTRDVLVVVDGKAWGQFGDSDLGVPCLEGFRHGKPRMPYRNICLGLMKAWERWGESKDWYCHMDHDCLVGSAGVLDEFAVAEREGVWIFGNDHRKDCGNIPFLDRFQRQKCELHYLIGCCMFLSKDFMSALHRDDFFERFLNYTNFFSGEIPLERPGGKNEMVYCLDEFLYPTLAVLHGGRVGELACWEGSGWRGLGSKYPMRFRPDLDEGDYEGACVMHPLKSDGRVREFHRRARSLTKQNSSGTISSHEGI
jgi:hypothetical protein